MHKTKAETCFTARVSHLLREGRRKPHPGPMMAVDEDAARRFRRELERPLPPDRSELELAFFRFGMYLELIGEDKPVGSRRLFQVPTPARAKEPVPS